MIPVKWLMGITWQFSSYYHLTGSFPAGYHLAGNLQAIWTI